MPNFKVHVYTGIFSYPLFLFIYLFILEQSNLPFELRPGILGAGYLLYLLGSDLPDLDSQTALIKRMAEVLITGVVAGVVYSFFLSQRVLDILNEYIQLRIIAITATFTISILIGVGISKLLNLLRHRGFLHTLWAALIYGGLIFGLTYPGSDFFRAENIMEKTEVLYLCIAGFSGYCLHIVLDIINTSFKRRITRRKR